MNDLENLQQRIDKVLSDNRKAEWLFIILTTILFVLGIACIATSLFTKNFVYSIPSAFTTFFLKYPLKEIKLLRRVLFLNVRDKNLAIAPALIKQLPTEKSAKEIQKLLENLHKDD